MNQDNKKEPRSSPSKLWVPVVVIIGAAIGFLTYFFVAANPPPPPPFGRHSFEFEPLRGFHIVFSTIGTALLVALLVVYGKTYRETKGNFILGLLVVLFALLFQSVLTNPLLFGLIERSPFQPGFSSPIADTFTIVAYAVFLYLSLE